MLLPQIPSVMNIRLTENIFRVLPQITLNVMKFGDTGGQPTRPFRPARPQDRKC
jgi:hypothetical protein